MAMGKIIKKYLPADYSDCFYKEIIPDNSFTVDRLFNSIFKDYPKCIMWLLKLRDILVKPFGLQGGLSFENLIIERNEEEIIIGKDDKHLSFWISLYSGLTTPEIQTISISTVVKYHNSFGKIYFAAIWIFHKIMVGYLFRRTIKTFEQKTSLY